MTTEHTSLVHLYDIYCLLYKWNGTSTYCMDICIYIHGDHKWMKYLTFDNFGGLVAYDLLGFSQSFYLLYTVFIRIWTYRWRNGKSIKGLLQTKNNENKIIKNTKCLWIVGMRQIWSIYTKQGILIMLFCVLCIKLSKMIL